MLAEALTAAHKNRGYFYEAELYRLKGELTLKQSKAGPELSRRVESSRSKVEEEVEGLFQKAMDIARRQGGKSWELRSTMSLARLWQQQRKKKAARQLLAEVYAWFTEGFDTADLKDAQAVLDELSQRGPLRLPHLVMSLICNRQLLYASAEPEPLRRSN